MTVMDPDFYSNRLCDNWTTFLHSLLESSIERPNLQITGGVMTDEWTTFVRPKSNTMRSQMPNALDVGDGPDGLIAAATSSLNTDIANSVLAARRMLNEFELVKNLKNTVASMRTFIFKVKSALIAERKLKENLSEAYSQINGPDIADTSEDIAMKKLPKLGKVYAELASNMKACNEATVILFQSSSKLIRKLEHLRKQCNVWRGKMLLHVKWLIQSRLENIGLLAHLYGKAHVDHSAIFQTNENARFCKLIATYNKSCVEHIKRYEMNDPIANMYIEGLADSISGHPVTAEWKGTKGNLLLDQSISPVADLTPITIDVILKLLSKYSIEDISYHVGQIVHKSVFDESEPLPQELAPVDSLSQGYSWSLASKVEIRPMQFRNNKKSFFKVIKRVANVTLPENALHKCKDDCASIMNVFDSLEMVVSAFLAGLGGKTKILHNFSENIVSDDAMSVASMSSRASSPLSHSTEFKTVVWKDSYNNEAMKAITSNHLDHLASSLSQLFLRYDHNSCQGTSLLSCISSHSDLDLIVMQAAITNLGCLDKLSNEVHESLIVTANNVIVKAALSCSDYIVCEMLGRMTPHFDKPSLQLSQGREHLCLATSLCISALQPLLHIAEHYPKNDVVTKIAIPSIQSLLTYGHYFVTTKIQHIVSMKDVRLLLSLALSDLRILTNTAIDCLKVVEGCHNEIEKRRSHDASTLIFSTKYLHDIDSLITKMQNTSTTTMARVSKIVSEKCEEILAAHFPGQKLWLQKSSLDTEVKNRYIQEMIRNLFKQVSSVLSDMDTQFQLAGIVPVVSAAFETILRYIASHHFKFSVQGGLQLGYDLTVLRDFLSLEDNGLSDNAKNVIPSLRQVKKAFEVAEILNSTSTARMGDGNSMYQRPPSRSYSVRQDENVMDLDNDFWVSLRRDGRESRKWSSFLPCL